MTQKNHVSTDQYEQSTLTEILYNPFLIKIFNIVEPLLTSNSAHDISHSFRVAKNALTLAQLEGGNQEVLVAAALLHDIVCLPKNHPDAKRSAELSRQQSEIILQEIQFPSEKITLVLDAIESHSFSAGRMPSTHEGKVFQDADRLDALGAIGIARTFATGATFNSKLYSIDDPLGERGRAFNDKAFMIDHFFEKLFKLPEKMITSSGRALAKERIIFMKKFLEQFKNEIGL